MLFMEDKIDTIEEACESAIRDAKHALTVLEVCEPHETIWFWWRHESAVSKWNSDKKKLQERIDEVRQNPGYECAKRLASESELVVYNYLNPRRNFPTDMRNC